MTGINVSRARLCSFTTSTTTAPGNTMPDSAEFLRKPALILGASGFIGARVMTALANYQNYCPIAASRRSAPQVDATDIKSVRGALKEIDCVINCISGSSRVMIGSTEVLCNAARDFPPRRIVHLSSMAVYGAATGNVSESQSPVMPVSPYGRAKIECERIVRKYVDDGGDAVILRPTCVFGPGSPQWTTRLSRLLTARRIGDLGSAGDGYCNLVFVDDVVAAIIGSLDAQNVSSHSFNISSTADITWNEFLVAFAIALGATPVRRISSREMLIEMKLLAPILRIANKLMGSSAPEAITPSLAALWRQDIRIDCSAAEMALSLPRTTAERMIAAVTRSMRSKTEVAFS